MRFMTWVALALLVYSAWRVKKARARLRALNEHTAATKPKSNPRSDPETEQMVPCQHCGVYIPISEAIVQAEITFCSEDHRRHHFES